MLKECVRTIGARIGEILSEKRSDAEKARWRRYLWTFVTYFWPAQIAPTKLIKLYDKLERSERSDDRTRA